jgi:hypothetical protein
VLHERGLNGQIKLVITNRNKKGKIMQQTTKQPYIIGALSGALVMSLGMYGYFYFNLKEHAVQNENVAPVVSEAMPAKASPVTVPSNEAGLKDLYGITSPSGQIKNALKIEGDESDTLTSHWFDKELKIGTDDLYVKFYKTQQLDAAGEPTQSHATPVIVGVITYKKMSNQWQVISKQKSFGEAGSWGDVPEAKAEILQLSPSSIALMIDYAGGGQGYFQEGKEIFAFANNNWRDVGEVITGGDNEGAGCDSEPVSVGEELLGPCWRYTGKISVIPGSNSEFPPLLVTRTGTESNEHRVSVKPASNVTYYFIGGKYVNPNEQE